MPFCIVPRSRCSFQAILPVPLSRAAMTLVLDDAVLEDLCDDVHLRVVHRDGPRLPVLRAQAAAPGLLARGRVVSGDGAVVPTAGQVQSVLAEQQGRSGDRAARQGPLPLAGRGVEGGQRAAAGEYDTGGDNEFVVVPVRLRRGRLRPQRLRRLAVPAGGVAAGFLSSPFGWPPPALPGASVSTAPPSSQPTAPVVRGAGVSPPGGQPQQTPAGGESRLLRRSVVGGAVSLGPFAVRP